MQKIANYKCDFFQNTFIDQHFHVDKIELAPNTIFDHEILIWNNNYPFSNEQLHSFPRLKMFINWGVEGNNIDCRDVLQKMGIVIKKIEFYEYLIPDTRQLKSDTLTFYLKKYYLKNFDSIYIVRHGETQWNKQEVFQGQLDSPLTQKGVTHAKSIANHLLGKEISCIFSSPLGRARQTAEIIANMLNIKVIVIPEFVEKHFGIFQGRKLHVVESLFSDFFIMRKKDPYLKLFIPYPEGESYFDVYLRVVKPLMSLLAQYNNFVIVGHESVNRILRGVIQEGSLEKMIAHRQKNNEIITIDSLKGTEEITHV